MPNQLIWEKGKSLPEDLTNGRYRFYFTRCNALTASIFWQAVNSTLITKWVDEASGHRINLVKASIVYTDLQIPVEPTNGKIEFNKDLAYDCILDIDVIGIPWALIIVGLTALLGVGIVAYMNLSKVEKITSTPVGQVSGLVIALAILGGVILLFKGR